VVTGTTAALGSRSHPREIPSRTRLRSPASSPRRHEGDLSQEPFRRRVRTAGWIVFPLWTLGLAVFSTVIYHRAFLGEDFATYNQAWTLIGTGHLNPYDTIYGFPFIKADFELIIWPLALIHIVLPSPIALVWIQDLAVGGSGLVAFLWVLDLLQRRRVPMGPTIAGAIAFIFVTVANAGVYQTLSFDVHLEPISTLFLVLSARALWLGRTRRALVFAAIVLLCGSFAAICLVGLGVSALLAGPSTRRSGLLLVAAGIGWTGLISALHANQGSGLSLYAYIAGRTSLSGLGGFVTLLGGALTHPSRVLGHLRERLADIWGLIRPVGVVGLASAWGFGVPLVVLLVNALNARADFLTNTFQNFAVYPFLSVGTVMVIVWLGSRFRAGAVVATVVALAVVAQAGILSYRYSPPVFRYAVSHVGPTQAAGLRAALARTPPHAEVISTITVMGRFCGRELCFFFYPDESRPVGTRDVVFVFDAQNEILTTEAGVQYAATYVRDDLHARVVLARDGITALEWHAPAGTRTITVPTGPPSR